jgi:serine/threonine-protein kinase HipA
MTDSLAVIMDDLVAGSLTRMPGGRLQFSYEEEYAALPEGTPLSLSMPLSQLTHPDSAITPWLWGLLPDDPSVLVRWERYFDLSRAVPFTLLATPIGLDCPGAVRFTDPARTEQVLHSPGQVTWLTTDDVAQVLRELERDSTSWLGAGFTGQFSLAGAQAKTALLYQDGRWGVPSSTAPTTHILKPAISSLAGHDLNEHLCLDAARRSGLHAVRSRIARFGDQSAIVVDRYDRYPSGSGFRRIHQEDLCQALAVPPTRKYQNEGGPGPRDIADLFRRVMPTRVADQAIRSFADALIWCRVSKTFAQMSEVLCTRGARAAERQGDFGPPAELRHPVWAVLRARHHRPGGSSLTGRPKLAVPWHCPSRGDSYSPAGAPVACACLTGTPASSPGP